MSRKVMNYINTKIKYLLGLDTEYILQYTVPHSKMSNDIFNMWDMLIAYPDSNTLYFIQISHRAQRKRAITEHNLLDAKNYLNSLNIIYLLITYKKRGRYYHFWIEQLIPNNDKNGIDIIQIEEDKRL